jgi:hypothetical protein
MGSGLDDRITGTSLQLQPIMTAKTRSIPYWTTSVFSSTVTETGDEFLLTLSIASDCDSLTDHSLMNSHVSFRFITSEEPNRNHHVEQLVVILLLFVFCLLLRNVATCY